MAVNHAIEGQLSGLTSEMHIKGFKLSEIIV